MYLLITFNNLLTTVIRRRNTSSVMQLLMITRTLFNNTSKKGKFINKINVQTFCCNDHYAIVYSIELKKRCQTFDTHQICIRYLWRRRKKKKRNIHNKREQNTFSKPTTVRILRSYFFTHVEEIMNYMAVAFQKVRQACRNGENSSFPNGSSLRKVETLTDSDNAVEKRVAFRTILLDKIGTGQ